MRLPPFGQLFGGDNRHLRVTGTVPGHWERRWDRRASPIHQTTLGGPGWFGATVAPFAPFVLFLLVGETSGDQSRPARVARWSLLRPAPRCCTGSTTKHSHDAHPSRSDRGPPAGPRLPVGGDTR